MRGGLPSKQMVNAVGGRRRAGCVRAGEELWTLDGRRTVRTTVTGVSVAKVRELVAVTTDRVTFALGVDQLLRGVTGWLPAAGAAASQVAWTPARKLCRERLKIVPGYDLGYVVGATCADGTVGRNYVSLVVNEEIFATNYATCLCAATGLDPRIERISRPSGYLGRDLPGFRVRVVSSYLADLMRQYVGGDAHHMRQRFPRVVLRDMATFEGFLDGYCDGDGHRLGWWDARVVTSANVPFLQELSTIIGARFTPKRNGRASQLCIADSWPRRGTFRPEAGPVDLTESEWVPVRSVAPVVAHGAKPYTVYAYHLDPYPTFLVNGHLVSSPS
ncbi:hypothetical protein [Streptomyces olivaceiscleroticus]|uniref:DOD-type homing endonuclease domain-containing protein n=1 Tax=Streptomyces olivaceiscleroticus TaxID=68245 RepID=A0ABP3LGQ9_9ACTN